jgi:hypothetical protein
LNKSLISKLSDPDILLITGDIITPWIISEGGGSLFPFSNIALYQFK